MHFYVTSNATSRYVDIDASDFSYEYTDLDITTLSIKLQRIVLTGSRDATVPRILQSGRRSILYHVPDAHLVLKVSKQLSSDETVRYTNVFNLIRHLNHDGRSRHGNTSLDCVLEPREHLELQVRQTTEKWPLVRYTCILYEKWQDDVFDWMWKVRRRFPARIVYKLVCFLCRALYTFRRHRCIHGDIKLENILMRMHGNAQTLDVSHPIVPETLQFIFTDCEGMAYESEHAPWCAGRGTRTYLHPSYRSRSGPSYIDDAHAAVECLLKFVTLDYNRLEVSKLSRTTLALCMKVEDTHPLIDFLWTTFIPLMWGASEAPSLSQLEQMHRVVCTLSL